MKVKVCGMREGNNVREVATLLPDFMGFIFYAPSPRNAIGIKKEIIKNLPEATIPIGVFVNSDKDEIRKIADFFNIQTLQLHGEETPQECKDLKNFGYTVIKAFKLRDNCNCRLDEIVSPYKDCVDLFLFDTDGKSPGGNGKKFNWEILSSYTLNVPYLISGGISPEDADLVVNGLPNNCIGIDINSKFEIEPGLKDTKKLSDFFSKLYSHT